MVCPTPVNWRRLSQSPWQRVNQNWPNANVHKKRITFPPSDPFNPSSQEAPLFHQWAVLKKKTPHHPPIDVLTISSAQEFTSHTMTWKVSNKLYQLIAFICCVGNVFNLFQSMLIEDTTYYSHFNQIKSHFFVCNPGRLYTLYVDSPTFCKTWIPLHSNSEMMTL